ncbi:MAG: tetratricopeptide repeat protein, partial [Proteobacteria bacterium]|nr:tetratricopeptide repeat protein [Pseudomonadota bacterium]
MQQSDFVTRGQALVDAGQFQEAVKVCRLGLLGRPTTVEGRIVLGQALLALKRFDEVLAEMRVALELDQGSTVARTLKGEALLRKGDHQGAIELFQQLCTRDPYNAQLAALLDEARRASHRPTQNTSHPSIGFLGGGGGGGDTKHYPSHPEDEERNTARDRPKAKTGGPSSKPQMWGEGGEDDPDGNYTRPTSLAAPAAKKKTSVSLVDVSPQPMPTPKVLAVGDRSGTVEVDPELDGIELDGQDEDFGALAAPPVSARTRRGPDLAEARGSVKRAAPAAARKPLPKKNQIESSTVELDDDELVELDEGNDGNDETKIPAARKPGPSTKVRSAVNLAAGPLPDDPIPSLSRSVASSRKTAPETAIGPHQLANMLAGQPHIMQQPLPQGPFGAPIAAALPTAAAMPMPTAPSQPPAWAKATVAAQLPQGGLGPGISGMMPPQPQPQ